MKDIYVNSWVKVKKDSQEIVPNNWGDDINFFFLPTITKCNHIPQFGYREGDNYAFIGSIVDNARVNKNTYIWGSGISDMKCVLKQTPKEICAVRGPLTYKRLHKDLGLKCPEIYGDPALLIPNYYAPKITKKYKIGIIPHYISLNNDSLKNWSNSEIKIIDLRHYKKWTDIIDQILACDVILSESLHGLIMANAYHIPNVWVKIDYEKMRIKYHDYFLSCGKDRREPYDINKASLEEIIQLATKGQLQNSINTDKLIQACPVL